MHNSSVRPAHQHACACCALHAIMMPVDGINSSVRRGYDTYLVPGMIHFASHDLSWSCSLVSSLESLVEKHRCKNTDNSKTTSIQAGQRSERSFGHNLRKLGKTAKATPLVPRFHPAPLRVRMLSALSARPWPRHCLQGLPQGQERKSVVVGKLSHNHAAYVAC